jgi:hypothetical protein
MYPETMEVTTDDMFLDETDVWANHSSKHIHAAIQSLTKWHKGVMRKALFVLRQADLTREQRTKICFLIRRILEN